MLNRIRFGPSFIRLSSAIYLMDFFRLSNGPLPLFDPVLARSPVQGIAFLSRYFAWKAGCDKAEKTAQFSGGHDIWGRSVRLSINDSAARSWAGQMNGISGVKFVPR